MFLGRGHTGTTRWSVMVLLLTRACCITHVVLLQISLSYDAVLTSYHCRDYVPRAPSGMHHVHIMPSTPQASIHRADDQGHRARVC